MQKHGNPLYGPDSGGQRQVKTALQPQYKEFRKQVSKPIAEPITLKQIQTTYRKIINYAKAIRKKVYVTKDEYNKLSRAFQASMLQLQTIEQNGLSLPFCPRLKCNDISAGLTAMTEEWSGRFDEKAGSNRLSYWTQLRRIKHRALVLAIRGNTDTDHFIVGDPMVAVGVRALQFNWYLIHLNTLCSASNTILNKVLNPNEVVGLSKADKVSISMAIRVMEENFPYKMKNKTYKGPEARDDYKLVRTSIRYNSSYSLKRVISNVLRYINRKIENPTRFTHSEEQRIVMRCLKRVNDELTRLEAGSAWKRDNQEEDLLLKAYPNAVILFTHGDYTRGKEVLDSLQNQLLDYLMLESEGQIGTDRNQTGDIYE